MPESGARPPPEPLRVVIADDHAFYRQGLARFLAMFGIDVVGEARDGAEAIEVVTETAPDVLLLDLNMPVLSGVEVIRRLTERRRDSRVVVVSVSAEEADVTAAIVAGASGYILKDEPVEEVVAGIRAAAAGESLTSPRIAALILQRIRERPEPVGGLPSPLSRRELDVLRLVAAGRSNEKIGEGLCIGPGTARNYVSSILMKLGVDNRVQAAVRAVRDGIV